MGGKVNLELKEGKIKKKTHKEKGKKKARIKGKKENLST